MTHAICSPSHPVLERQELRATSPLQNLDWLIRYARHTGMDLSAQGDPLPEIRSMFTAGAWRLLCRSAREDFLPILRNRELNLHSLVHYCEQLVRRSFVVAPAAMLLHFFVNQRRLYFSLPCRIPEGDDYELIRVAARSPVLKTRDIASVTNWVNQAGVAISARNSWGVLVVRARRFWHEQEMNLMEEEQEPWHFFCRGLDWRGYKIEPIGKPSQLWLEGRHQGNCLYKLRFECEALKPSRFFSIRRAGRRVATLELSWRLPERGDRGMNLILGAWELQDLRKSYNRLPDQEMLSCMHAFARQYDILAKRPGRMPEGGMAAHLAEIRRRVCTVTGRDYWPLWHASLAALS